MVMVSTTEDVAFIDQFFKEMKDIGTFRGGIFLACGDLVDKFYFFPVKAAYLLVYPFDGVGYHAIDNHGTKNDFPALFLY